MPTYTEWVHVYLGADLTYHKVRQELWGQLCALRASGADIPMSHREWCTVRSYLCARNQEVSREAAYASDNIVVGTITSMESRVSTPA